MNLGADGEGKEANGERKGRGAGVGKGAVANGEVGEVRE